MKIIPHKIFHLFSIPSIFGCFHVRNKNKSIKKITSEYKLCEDLRPHPILWHIICSVSSIQAVKGIFCYAILSQVEVQCVGLRTIYERTSMGISKLYKGHTTTRIIIPANWRTRIAISTLKIKNIFKIRCQHQFIRISIDPEVTRKKFTKKIFEFSAIH